MDSAIASHRLMNAALLVLFAALPGVAFSQQTYRVLAENGLKLRAAPSQAAKVLAVAPFLSEVEVLADTANFRPQQELFERPISRWPDTVGVLFHTYDYKGRVFSTPHTGYWYECRYQGQQGFMFGGFLEKVASIRYPNKDEELNDRFRLRMQDGDGCSSNHPELSKSWQWSGLFKKGDGFELRPVHPTYAVQDWRPMLDGGCEIICSETVFRTADTVPPLFIFGAKTSWPRRSLVGWKMSLYPENTGVDPEFPRLMEIAKKAGLEPERLNIDCGGWRDTSWVWQFRGNDGKRHPVSFSTSSNGIKYVFGIEWIGDLDGDGRPDFIFTSYGRGEQSAAKVLFLSTLAKKGEPFGPAAVLWLDDCC